MKSRYRIARLLVKMCNTLEVSINEVRSGNRKQHLCDARKIICYILRGQGLTLEEIGKFLKRDHSTIGYNIREYHTMISINKNFECKAIEIKDLLKNENPAYT
ncbi:dnaA protein helix-turn-helix [Chryseobacterium ureilyticum]|uniref:DnaA protein helix-turn-helix n=1 Tax=Chryseobacterium ureilyticum TaxID=373668 RepID=A0A1N7QRY3_9FLAO|nr:helix-turn-helix domain-containing protein [Chryseobacterium ureilyticum]SIT25524.1 dnaA protein helix-turn-helix [Chryseobacterium ureilyticum]